MAFSGGKAVGGEPPAPTPAEIDEPYCVEYTEEQLDFNPTLGEITDATGESLDGFGLAEEYYNNE